MERIDLQAVQHTVERVWTADPFQGRQATIRVGRLADGRWWVDRDDGHRWVGAWACDSELQAEETAHRWSERSALRWRRTATASTGEADASDAAESGG